MKSPLKIPLYIRSEKGDKAYVKAYVNKHKNMLGIRENRLLNSPSGGIYGMVRSQGHKAHKGWDFYAPVNTPVVAITDGKIVAARSSHDYGLFVTLAFKHPDYPNGLYAFYAHLCHTAMSVGQFVEEGDTIGYTGNSGNAWGTPPHLHFEIRTIFEPPAKSGLHCRINPVKVLGVHNLINWGASLDHDILL